MPKRIVSGDQSEKAPKPTLKAEEFVEEIKTDEGPNETVQTWTYMQFYEDVERPEMVTRRAPIKQVQEVYRDGKLYERMEREFKYADETYTQRAGV